MLHPRHSYGHIRLLIITLRWKLWARSSISLIFAFSNVVEFLIKNISTTKFIILVVKFGLHQPISLGVIFIFKLRCARSAQIYELDLLRSRIWRIIESLLKSTQRAFQEVTNLPILLKVFWIGFSFVSPAILSYFYLWQRWRLEFVFNK